MNNSSPEKAPDAGPDPHPTRGGDSRKREKDISPKYVKYVFGLVFLINLFNYIDRQVLYAVFPLIKIDLSLTDTQLGMLASSFIIVYMVFAPLTGYFGDRLHRPRCMGASAILWSMATVIAGYARSYSQLIFARSGVGIGEAGYGAMSPSFVAEWFSLEKRARVLAFFAIAIPVGSAIGYVLGGQLGEVFGWRRAFFIVGAPGIMLGIILLFVKDPRRHLKEKYIPPLFGHYRALLKNKTYILTSLAQAMATFSLGGLAAWMPTYFVRYFNMPVGKAGIVFGGITVFAGVLGTLSGGWTADWLLKKRKRAYFIVSCAGFLLSVPFGVICVLSGQLYLAAAALFAAEVFVFAYSGPLQAAIVKVTRSNMRSMAFALNIFIIHAFGDAVSPTVIGMLSDRWGLKLAVFVCVIFLVFGGVFSLAAGHTFDRDEKNGENR